MADMTDAQSRATESWETHLKICRSYGMPDDISKNLWEGAVLSGRLLQHVKSSAQAMDTFDKFFRGGPCS